MTEGRPTAWEGRTPHEWRQIWNIPSLVVLETTTSTNDVAMRLAAEGAAAGTTVIADRQTRGRGREGRTWVDMPGRSLLISVVLSADRGGTDPSTMPLRTGLAVARAIEDAAAVETRIKWPNDILATDGRKIAGVLCEGASGAGHGWLVAGMGINVLQRSDDLESAVRPDAASIAMLGGATTRADLAGRILDALRPFRVVPPPLDQDTLDALARRDALRGRQVTVNDSVACTAIGIAPDGELRVRRGGRQDTIRAGSIRLVPPDPALDRRSDDQQTRSEANR